MEISSIDQCFRYKRDRQKYYRIAYLMNAYSQVDCGSRREAARINERDACQPASYIDGPLIALARLTDCCHKSLLSINAVGPSNSILKATRTDTSRKDFGKCIHTREEPCSLLFLQRLPQWSAASKLFLLQISIKDGVTSVPMTMHHHSATRSASPLLIDSAITAISKNPW